MRSLLDKTFTFPESVVSGVHTIAIRTQLISFFLAVLFTILGNVASIKTLTKQVLIFICQPFQESTCVTSVGKLQVLVTWPVGNLLSNDFLPGSLSSQHDLSHAGSKQMKATPLIRHKAIRVNVPAQNLQSSQQG